MSLTDDRIIERLVAEGLVDDAQLEDARKVVAQMADMGLKARGVSEILVEKEIVSADDKARIERELRRELGQEQIAGYRLLEQLGEGAMGSVYKARQLSLDRDVAIKVLAKDLGEDPAFVDRFMTEARAVARVNHTNIISGIDVGESGGIRYLVMEYADGMTVADLLKRGGAMDEERVLRIAVQMARALDHAHRSNLVHRDVKPDNIILTKDGVAKLCDLGLAKIDAAPGADSARMGTPDYMSPEQARGAGHVDERTDLYSLGATLFHMLTGRPPFVGDNAQAIMTKHLAEPPASPVTVRGDISDETAALVLSLLAKQTTDRPASAKDLISAFEERLQALQASRSGSGAGAPTARGGAARPAAPSAPAVGKAPVARRRRRRR